MGKERIILVTATDKQQYVRERYRELLHITKVRDPLQFRFTAKGYYVSIIADETGYTEDYVNRIINGKR
jgi:hypothetical protein